MASCRISASAGERQWQPRYTRGVIAAGSTGGAGRFALKTAIHPGLNVASHPSEDSGPERPGR